MPHTWWEWTGILAISHAATMYLIYLQWLSDDSNFHPTFKDFDPWGD